MKNEEDLVKKALKFAAQKHKNQTFTDGSGMPYIEHCKRVYWNLKKYASGEFEKKDVLFATALLHDTIEDTDTTFEELVQNFGEEVARNVKALSKQPSFFPHFLKMEVYLHDIASTSKEAMMVKLADRITNITHIHPLWDYEKVVEYLDD